MLSWLLRPMYLQLLIVSLIVITAWALAVGFLALARLRPPRLNEMRALFLLGRMTPQDLGLQFESRWFPVRTPAGKQLRLASWLVPHPDAAGRTVILVHGYADAKIGAASWLPALHRQRVNVLLLDLPAHGESEGLICTAGWREREYLAQIVDQLRSQVPDLARRVVLFGLSMGASAAGGAACLRPEAVAGVIMDSPFSDFRRAALLHGNLFGLPGAIVQRPANWVMARIVGADYGQIAPIELLQRPPCPVLLIQAGEDQLVGRADQAEMQRRVEVRAADDGISCALTVPGAAHLLGLCTASEEYERVLGEFIAKAMKD